MADLYSLGLGEPLPISAHHGKGIHDLLDELVTKLPPPSAEGEPSSTIEEGVEADDDAFQRVVSKVGMLAREENRLWEAEYEKRKEERRKESAMAADRSVRERARMDKEDVEAERAAEGYEDEEYYYAADEYGDVEMMAKDEADADAMEVEGEYYEQDADDYYAEYDEDEALLASAAKSMNGGRQCSTASVATRLASFKAMMDPSRSSPTHRIERTHWPVDPVGSSWLLLDGRMLANLRW